MKMWEINQMTRQEVEEKLIDALEEYQNLRFQHATQQLDNKLRLRTIRRDIARLKTVVREMNQGKRPEQAGAAKETK